MRIEFDPAKRDQTLTERGLDFADAPRIFAGAQFTFPDKRMDYGEPRYITVGWLQGRLAVLAWTPRGEARRIISMRYANEREVAKYQARLG